MQWLCGDDDGAKQVVAGLIEDMGYVPVDIGGTADAAVMEAPRRPGSVYGEEYRASRRGCGGGGGPGRARDPTDAGLRLTTRAVPARAGTASFQSSIASRSA